MPAGAGRHRQHVFGVKSGVDIITDFKAPDGDRLDLNAYAHGTVNGRGIVITQVGTDTVVALSGSNAVTLTGVAVADLASHITW